MAQSSRQTIYSNEDLNKPVVNSKSKTYTNKDLDTQDDFQPDDDFDASANTVDDFQPDDEPVARNESIKKPSLWEQINTPLIDAPSRIAKDIADSIDKPQLNRSPIRARFEGFMGGATEGVGNLISEMTTPLSIGTSLATPFAKPIIRGVGAVTGAIGKGLKNYPLTDWIPGSRFVVPPAVRRLDKNLISGAAGRGLENIGQRMRSVGRIDNPASAPLADDILAEPTVLPKRNMRERIQEVESLPESNPLAQQILDEASPEVQLSQTPFNPNNPQGLTTPPKGMRYDEYGVIQPIDNAVIPPSAIQKMMQDPNSVYNSAEPTMSPSAIKAMEQVRPTKPAVRLNPDGTYTRFDTGEIVDSTGKPMAAPVSTKVPKELTAKNAPPNQRAKIMRGQHDAVDIIFDNPADRRVFGAGQNMFLKGETKPGLAQTYTDISNQVSKEYGLPIEKARELVTDYNRRLRELSKDMPKYGEDLNFKAPSFETYMDSVLRNKS